MNKIKAYGLVLTVCLSILLIGSTLYLTGGKSNIERSGLEQMYTNSQFTISACDQNKIEPVFSPDRGKKDDIIDIQIKITENTSVISSFGLDLLYDSSFFSYVSTTTGSLSADWGTVGANVTAVGTLTVGGFPGSGTPINTCSTGTIAIVKLKVISSGIASLGSIEIQTLLQSQVCIKDYVDDISGMTPNNSCATFTYGAKTRFDCDGDGKTDIGIFRENPGTWHILQSTDGYKKEWWGGPGDIPVTGDWDGDGKADIGVFRENPGIWYLLQSNDGYKKQWWGGPGDTPVVGDWDGDGKDDIGVFRANPGTWHILQSTDGYKKQWWGGVGDIPIVGDWDGDGKDDIGVFRKDPGIWFLLQSTDGYIKQWWGGTNDAPVVGDWDGDGKDDIAVFRANPGIWFILQSTDGYKKQWWGGPGDTGIY